jgi:hypothetical protein
MMVSDLRDEEEEADEAEEVLEGVTGYFRVRFGEWFYVCANPHRF